VPPNPPPAIGGWGLEIPSADRDPDGHRERGRGEHGACLRPLSRPRPIPGCRGPWLEGYQDRMKPFLAELTPTFVPRATVDRFHSGFPPCRAGEGGWSRSEGAPVAGKRFWKLRGPPRPGNLQTVLDAMSAGCVCDVRPSGRLPRPGSSSCSTNWLLIQPFRPPPLDASRLPLGWHIPHGWELRGSQFWVSGVVGQGCFRATAAGTEAERGGRARKRDWGENGRQMGRLAACAGRAGRMPGSPPRYWFLSQRLQIVGGAAPWGGWGPKRARCR